MSRRLRKQTLSPPVHTRFLYVSGINPEATTDIEAIHAEFSKFGPLDNSTDPAIEFAEGNVRFNHFFQLLSN